MIDGTEKPKIPSKFAKRMARYNEFDSNKLLFQHFDYTLTLGVGIPADIDLARETDSFSFSAAVYFNQEKYLFLHCGFNNEQIKIASFLPFKLSLN